jgi:hypothetical protein
VRQPQPLSHGYPVDGKHVYAVDGIPAFGSFLDRQHALKLLGFTFRQELLLVVI